jgi:A/G-specific adenine glycosylase
MLAPDGGSAQPEAQELLRWYDRHRRRLPWRALPGEAADPYRVWLSEIMLQQTTVQAVKPYYEAFLVRFPSVEALASAPAEDVMRLWAGLGYYSRARNLHACAKEVVERFGGAFPADEATLLTLPGVGAYTAAAVSAIAFGRRAVVVDGNVERVIARLQAIEQPLPGAKPTIRWHADTLTPHERPGDFAQAMMDLGATICTPRRPSCALCPFLGRCAAQRAGTQESYPRKVPKREGALRRGLAFVAVRADGAVLARTRALRGLLGGMSEVPTSEWVAGREPWSEAEAVAGAPFAAAWRLHPEPARHGFTHFPLELQVLSAALPADAAKPEGLRWVRDIADEPFPTVFRKVLAIGLA